MNDQPEIEIADVNPVHAQYETAARLYCEKAGYDPDLPIPAPHPLGLDVKFTVPNWTLVADDLCDLSRKLVSLKEAAGGTQPTKVPVGGKPRIVS